MSTLAPHGVQAPSLPPPAGVGPCRASIVLEWENLRWSERARCAALLAELARQVEALAPAAAAPEPDVELLVLHDGACMPAEEVRAFVLHSVGTLPARLGLRVLAGADASYYGLKNEGARAAGGDIVVFVDSDVLPEPGWLRTLLEAFHDPRVEVAGGQAYLATDSLVARTLALCWFFPLRDPRAVLEPRAGFFANNVALRREVALEYPFPALPGSSRGACRLLAQRLRAEGRGVFVHTGARVQHPAPRGARHLLRRALAQGRDNLLLERALGGGGVAASLARVARLQARACKRLLRHRRRVGLRLHALPAALALATAWHALYGAGDLLTRLAPGWAGRHLRV
ncbi:MAG: glycosyltransferase [Planctomycetia bacterium]